MSSTKKSQESDSSLARPHHLVTAESRGKPLCGEASPDALIGSYVEHLDDKHEFVREIFGKNGKPAPACERCLALYPSVVTIRRDERKLRRITPFNLRVNVAFAPDTEFSGYWISANGLVEIGDKRVVADVFPLSRFVPARWLYALRFDMSVDAPLVVPLVNKANKD